MLHVLAFCYSVTVLHVLACRSQSRLSPRRCTKEIPKSERYLEISHVNTKAPLMPTTTHPPSDSLVYEKVINWWRRSQYLPAADFFQQAALCSAWTGACASGSRWPTVDYTGDGNAGQLVQDLFVHPTCLSITTTIKIFGGQRSRCTQDREINDLDGKTFDRNQFQATCTNLDPEKRTVFIFIHILVFSLRHPNID